MVLKKIIITLAIGTIIGAFAYNATLSNEGLGLMKGINTIVVLFGLYAFNFLVIELLTRQISDTEEQKIIQKIAKPMTSLVALTLIAGIWSDNILIAMAGLFLITGALIIAGREFFLNYFGGLYLSINKTFSKGDRIEIDGYRGDVLDYGPTNTKIMETHKEHTGKIINIPNSLFLTHPSKNVTGDSQYVWSEIEIHLDKTPSKDLIKKIESKIIDPLLKPISLKAEEKMRNLSDDYLYYKQDLNPTIYTEFHYGKTLAIVRFIVEEKNRRDVESKVLSALEEIKK